MLTCNPGIVSDAVKLFNILENPYSKPAFEQILVSPYQLRHSINRMVSREAANAKNGMQAYIHAKFNSLTDEKMIRNFYRAAESGVKIKLIVRGACCLRPPQNGNIEVISIVDTLLEHARFMIFANGGNEKVYITSADIMTRNLDRRIETAVPVLDHRLRENIRQVFDIEWSDNTKASMLTASDKKMYVKRQTTGISAVRSQKKLYSYYDNQTAPPNEE